MNDSIIVFKNNLPNLTVLRLSSGDLAKAKEKLQKKIKQAPMMFIGMQLIIDISFFDQLEQLPFDISELVTFLQGEGLNPVAVMTDRASFRESLVKTGLGAIPVLHNKVEHRGQQNAQGLKSTRSFDKAVKEPTEKKSQVSSEEPRKTFEEPIDAVRVSRRNQVLRQPIRSGQRVYAQGDLTIVGSVSPGAEVIADGSIHVYGKLSGRVIAGAKGDESTGIFCQNLDAELVSIAGNYKQLEDISADYRHKRVQISLENEKIVFSPL